MRTVRNLFTLLLFFVAAVSWAEPLSFEQLASMRTAGGVKISPDGQWVAYTLSVPRDLTTEDDGGAWAELRVVPATGGNSLPYVQGQVNVSGVQFSPDSKHLYYLSKGEKNRALFAIPVGGGGPRKMFEHTSNVVSYSISPDGQHVAFISVPAESKERKAAKKKGFTEEVFEEDWRPRELHIAPLPAFDGAHRVANSRNPVKLKSMAPRLASSGSKMASDC